MFICISWIFDLFYISHLIILSYYIFYNFLFVSEFYNPIILYALNEHMDCNSWFS